MTRFRMLWQSNPIPGFAREAPVHALEQVSRQFLELDGVSHMVVGESGLLQLWNLESGALIRTFGSEVEGSWMMFVDQRGDLVGAIPEGRVFTWNVADGRLLRSFDVGEPILSIVPVEGEYGRVFVQGERTFQRWWDGRRRWQTVVPNDVVSSDRLLAAHWGGGLFQSPSGELSWSSSIGRGRESVEVVESVLARTVRPGLFDVWTVDQAGAIRQRWCGWSCGSLRSWGGGYEGEGADLLERFESMLKAAHWDLLARRDFTGEPLPAGAAGVAAALFGLGAYILAWESVRSRSRLWERLH